MDRHEADWLQRTKGKDVAGILRAAGIPCTGTRNYIPQFEKGYEPDIDVVWDLLFGPSDQPEPAVKRRAGRPRGSKNKPRP